jgi:hypothetical protein
MIKGSDIRFQAMRILALFMRLWSRAVWRGTRILRLKITGWKPVPLPAKSNHPKLLTSGDCLSLPFSLRSDPETKKMVREKVKSTLGLPWLIAR